MIAPCTLWLIRHGETDWNVAGRLQGQLEVPLNEKGRRQAQQVAARLGGEAKFAAIFTSDLGRARETAVAVSRVLGLPSTVREDLRERHFGLLSELTLEEIAARHPELSARLRAREPDFVPEGGESLWQTYERSCRALSEIAREWPGAQVIVVTHGGVIDAAWRAAMGLPLQVRRELELSNASVNRVKVSEGRFELVSFGDVAHL